MSPKGLFSRLGYIKSSAVNANSKLEEEPCIKFDKIACIGKKKNLFAIGNCTFIDDILNLSTPSITNLI